MYDPSSDLASVKRILDAAKAQNFHSFLLEQSSPLKDKPHRENDIPQTSLNDKDSTNAQDDSDEPSPFSPQSKGSNSNDDLDSDMMEVASAEQFAQMVITVHRNF